MAWPEEYADTVEYRERELITQSNLALRLVNGSRLDLIGLVYLNGTLITASVGTADNLKVDKTTAINTTAPLTGGGDLSTSRTLAVNNFTTSVKGTVPPPGSVSGKYLKDDGTWDIPVGSGTVTDGDKGEITVASGVWSIDGNAVTTAKIADNAVTAAKLADMTADTIKGRVSTAGDPQDLTPTQVTALLNTFTATLKGLVPAPTAATGRYLRDDGTWQTVATGGGVSDGDKTDITVSSSGTVWTIDNSAVTYAKIQNVTADKLLGRKTAGAGVTEEIDCTATSRSLFTSSSVSAWRTNLDVPPRTLAINTTAPLTGGGNLQADRTLDISVFTQTVKGAVPAPVTIGGLFLRDDGTWQAAGGGGSLTDGDKGEITVAASGSSWTIDAGVVTNAKLANMADGRFKGNNTGATGPPVDIGGAAATAMLDTFLTTNKGLVPPPMTATGKFLKDDGTWDVPAGGGGGVTDGDKGDIVVSDTGATWMFDSTVVTAVAKTVLDDMSTTAMRTTLNACSQTDFNTLNAIVTDFLVEKFSASPAQLWLGEAPSNGTNYAVVAPPADLTAQADITLPGATTTLVGRNTTDTLLNKTMESDTNIYRAPVGSQSGKYLKDNGTWDYPGYLNNIASRNNAAHTAALADVSYYLRFGASNPIYTIPDNATVAFPIGTVLEGAGVFSPMTISPAGGVTINRARTLQTTAVFAGWTLIKVNTNEWDAHGDFV